jgi:hypothetical protein
MSTDHQDVVKFMSSFAALRAKIQDDPSDLVRKAANDEDLSKCCQELASVAWHLQHAESQEPQLFAAPVNPAFIKVWRDYEARYFRWMAVFEFAQMGIDLTEPGPFIDSQLELKLKLASEEADKKFRAIHNVFEFVQREINTEDWDEDFVDTIETGIRAWRDLQFKCGLDVARVFRRREMIPFTLIPRHISEHYSPQETRSLQSNLQQAHEAFIFGVPFAALALMRSIAEAVLQHYPNSSNCKGLQALINNAKSYLPERLFLRIQNLKDLADSILHMNPTRALMPSKINWEILLLLFVLLELIETTPSDQ